MFTDPEAKRICDSLDYDFSEKRQKMESPAGLYGALEVAQRQYDLRCEIAAYLKEHPMDAVVNLGCGLDDRFSKADNGLCRSYNLDFPDVITVRNELLPAAAWEEKFVFVDIVFDVAYTVNCKREIRKSAQAFSEAHELYSRS